MSDGGADAKVFDQSSGSEDLPIAIRLNAHSLFDTIERIEAAADERPALAGQFRGFLSRAKGGVEQIGVIRVVMCDCPGGCGATTIELHPSRDLLDFLAEAEGTGQRHAN